MISLPFKILMFVLVDGWQLLIGALVILIISLIKDWKAVIL